MRGLQQARIAVAVLVAYLKVTHSPSERHCVIDGAGARMANHIAAAYSPLGGTS